MKENLVHHHDVHFSPPTFNLFIPKPPDAACVVNFVYTHPLNSYINHAAPNVFIISQDD